MGSYQVFNDLPQIHVDENSPLHDGYVWNAVGGDPQDCWTSLQTLKTACMTTQFHGTRFSFMPGGVPTTPSLQRFLLDPERDALPPQLPSPQYAITGTSARPINFNRAREAQSPYPFVDTRQRFVSPGDSWHDDRSATELASSSPGSDWSSRSSTGDIYPGVFKDLRISVPYSHDCDASFRGQKISFNADYTSAAITQRPSIGRSKTDSCVALREVQQYPDAVEPADIQDEGIVSDMKMDYQFTESFDAPHKSIDDGDYVHQLHDEGLGSSCKEQSMEPCNVGDGDKEDDVSDYTPSPKTKRRRCSQNSIPSPKSPSKRRLRQQRRTSHHDNTGSKVTKPSKVQRWCAEHSRSFRSGAEYKKHIHNEHRLRPFTCTLAYYGCTSTFGSKNEWKRHIASQHLCLGFWRCDQGTCTNDPKRPNDFNRKDLFTQHLRRMHGPDGSLSAKVKGKKGQVVKREMGAQVDKAKGAESVKEWEAGLEEVRNRCFVQKRNAPNKSRCEVCGMRFAGEGSWEERMEHVGRHFERRNGVEEDNVNVKEVGGGAKEWKVDEDLREWLVEEGLLEEVSTGQWRLVDQGKVVVNTAGAGGEDEVDAEAEDE